MHKSKLCQQNADQICWEADKIISWKWISSDLNEDRLFRNIVRADRKLAVMVISILLKLEVK